MKRSAICRTSVATTRPLAGPSAREPAARAPSATGSGRSATSSRNATRCSASSDGPAQAGATSTSGRGRRAAAGRARRAPSRGRARRASSSAASAGVPRADGRARGSPAGARPRRREAAQVLSQRGPCREGGAGRMRACDPQRDARLTGRLVQHRQPGGAGLADGDVGPCDGMQPGADLVRRQRPEHGVARRREQRGTLRGGRGDRVADRQPAHRLARTRERTGSGRAGGEQAEDDKLVRQQTARQRLGGGLLTHLRDRGAQRLQQRGLVGDRSLRRGRQEGGKLGHRAAHPLDVFVREIPLRVEQPDVAEHPRPVAHRHAGARFHPERRVGSGADDVGRVGDPLRQQLLAHGGGGAAGDDALAAHGVDLPLPAVRERGERRVVEQHGTLERDAEHS
jgi:hypothetical protein